MATSPLDISLQSEIERERCDDLIDNDGDGQIDENCVVPKFFNLTGTENSWQATGIIVYPGSLLNVHASGQICNWYNTATELCDEKWYSPDGANQVADNSFIAPPLRKYSLIAKIGIDGEPFWVGEDFEHILKQYGELYLTYNSEITNSFAIKNGDFTISVNVTLPEVCEDYLDNNTNGEIDEAGCLYSPGIKIMLPVEGMQLTEEVSSLFSGAAFDPQDGMLTGENLVWESNKDGVIGYGNTFSSNSLSSGDHVIIFKAIDSDGNINSTNINIYIEPKNTPVILTPQDSDAHSEGDCINFVSSYNTGIFTNPETGESTYLDWVVWYAPNIMIGKNTPFRYCYFTPGTHTINLSGVCYGCSPLDPFDTVIVKIISSIPKTKITSPLQWAQFSEGDIVNFIGTGIDEQDGNLEGNSLIWESNIDGLLGSGTSLSLNTLTSGIHKISLTSTDGDGNFDTDYISIEVHSSSVPHVNIIYPEMGQCFQVNTHITFSGEGLDVQDGTLLDGSLVWNSDIDGNIGSGQVFMTENLSEGFHLITLTATDSEGKTATDTISINVAQMCNYKILNEINFGSSMFVRDFVFSSDFGKIYALTDSEILFIDLSDNSISDTIPLPGPNNNLAITPDNNFIYVTQGFLNQVKIISIAGKEIIKTIDVGHSPSYIIIPNSEKAFISNYSDKTLSVIDIKNNIVINTIDMPGNPMKIKSGINDEYILVATMGDSWIVAVDIDTGRKTDHVRLYHLPVVPIGDVYAVWPCAVDTNNNKDIFYTIANGSEGFDPADGFSQILIKGAFNVNTNSWEYNDHAALWELDSNIDQEFLDDFAVSTSGDVFLPLGSGENAKLIVFPTSENVIVDDFSVLPLGITSANNNANPTKILTNPRDGRVYLSFTGYDKILIIGQ